MGCEQWFIIVIPLTFLMLCIWFHMVVRIYGCKHWWRCIFKEKPGDKKSICKQPYEYTYGWILKQAKTKHFSRNWRLNVFSNKSVIFQYIILQFQILNWLPYVTFLTDWKDAWRERGWELEKEANMIDRRIDKKRNRKRSETKTSEKDRLQEGDITSIGIL